MDGTKTDKRSDPYGALDGVEFNHNSVVIDLHTNTSLKMNMPGLHVSRSHVRSVGFFWPLTLRTGFDRLAEGGVDVIFSGLVAPEEEFVKDLKLNSWEGLSLRALSLRHKLGPFSPFKYCMHQLEVTRDKVRAYNTSRLRKRLDLPPVGVPNSYDDLKETLDFGQLALVHSIEGAHALHGSKTHDYLSHGAWQHHESDIRTETLSNLEKYAEAGVAYITMGHYYPNVAAGTTFSYPQRIAKIVRRRRWTQAWQNPTHGLSAIGRDIIERMLELGVIVDVAHVTPTTRAQIYDIVESTGKKGAIIASHVGAYDINPDPYNMENEEIERIANMGGVIGVMFSNYWLAGHEASALGIGLISRTLQHFLQNGGVECLALGSDFDGFSDPPDDLVDAAEMPRITLRLMMETYLSDDLELKQEEIRKIIGGNALRVLKDGWGRAPET